MANTTNNIEIVFSIRSIKPLGVQNILSVSLFCFSYLPLSLLLFTYFFLSPFCFRFHFVPRGWCQSLPSFSIKRWPTFIERQVSLSRDSGEWKLGTCEMKRDRDERAREKKEKGRRGREFAVMPKPKPKTGLPLSLLFFSSPEVTSGVKVFLSSQVSKAGSITWVRHLQLAAPVFSVNHLEVKVFARLQGPLADDQQLKERDALSYLFVCCALSLSLPSPFSSLFSLSLSSFSFAASRVSAVCQCTELLQH